MDDVDNETGQDFDISEMFNDKTEKVANKEVTTTPDAEDKTQDRDDVKSDDSENKDDVEKTEEDNNDWSKKAVLDERKKRQERDSEIEKLKKELEDLKAGKTKPEVEQEDEEDIDLIENPEGFKAKLKQDMELQILQTRIDFDQLRMREKHKDYDDVVEKFKDFAKDKPEIIKDFQKAQFPAQFAYDYVKNYEIHEKLKNPESLAKYREELKAEILKEIEAENTSKKTTLPKLSGSQTVSKTETDPFDIAALFRSQ